MGEALGCISRDEDKDIQDTPLKSQNLYHHTDHHGLEHQYVRGQEKFGLCIEDQVTWIYKSDLVPKGTLGSVVDFVDDRVRIRFPNGTWDFDPLEVVKDRNGGMPPLSLGNVPTTAGSEGGQSDAFGGWGMSSRSMGSTTSARWTATARAQARESGRAALARLREGNLKYLAGGHREHGIENGGSGRPEPCAIVCCCTPVPAPLDVVFGVSVGELACVASASLDHRFGDDGGAAALEFSLATNPEVHLMVVMESLGVNEQASQATATVWEAVEQILRHSDTVRGHMRRGALFVHAALFELSTGQVRFLGEHTNQAKLISSTPRSGNLPLPGEANIAGPIKPGVPPEEALAILQCGNVRAAGKVVQPGRNTIITPRASHAEDGDPDPYAMVFMSFDPHKGEGPLLELIFDTHPSQLATLSLIPPEAGDDVGAPGSDELWNGYIHWAEYCLTEHTTKLMVVLGRASGDASNREILKAKTEVFANMLQLLKRSTLVKAGVADGQLQVEGAVYFGDARVPPGHVEWLGAHPDQVEITQKMRHPGSSAILSQKDLPQGDALFPQDDGMAGRVLRDLQAGNQRYLASGPAPHSRWRPDYLPKLREKGAKAIVLSGANGAVRMPEHLFDSTPGDLLVHRTCGAISGRRDGCALTFLEKMVRRHPEVRLLLVVGDVLDPVVSTATTQVQRLTNPLRPANAQMAIEQLGPAVVHAWRQVRPDDLRLESQQQTDLAAYATELHVVYVLERILRDSDHILELVKQKRLEVQGAIAEADGSVRFIGGHTDIQRLIEQQAHAERHRRKGLGLGPGRKTPRSQEM